jgi:hypothetical protein
LLAVLLGSFCFVEKKNPQRGMPFAFRAAGCLSFAAAVAQASLKQTAATQALNINQIY